MKHEEHMTNIYAVLLNVLRMIRCAIVMGGSGESSFPLGAGGWVLMIS